MSCAVLDIESFPGEVRGDDEPARCSDQQPSTALGLMTPGNDLDIDLDIDCA